MRRISCLTRIGWGLGLLAFVCSCGSTAGRVDDAALAQKAAQCRPPWDGYDEALKQCLGAAPTADWRGEPRMVTVKNGDLCVEFGVEGPWLNRAFLPPILARDPLGCTLVSWKSESANGTGRAWFRIPVEQGSLAPAWVEVRYPGGTRRLVPGANP